ncbi:MAG: hypothetical protein KDH96_02075 [Candidatus Riesia sp.]|nr:hypothetical protein [Candidatus Riesia sp.]
MSWLYQPLLQGSAQQQSGGATSYTLSASSGSITITGTSVTFKRQLIMPVSAGSYSITGTSASLLYNRLLSSSSGAYSITGSTALLEYHRLFTVASGSYDITGTNVAFYYNRAITASSGTYTITGTSAKAILDAIHTTTSTKDYYLDSDGNIYWVIDQAVGSVEEV